LPVPLPRAVVRVLESDIDHVAREQRATELKLEMELEKEASMAATGFGQQRAVGPALSAS